MTLRRPRSSSVAKLLLVAAPWMLSGSLLAQTLARPGWVGSGLTVSVWWRHAVVYALDPRAFHDSDGNGVGDLPGVATKLDYLRSLGVDAVLLQNVQPAGTQGIDPAIGTMQDFTALLNEASRHGVRVLVEIQPVKTGEDVTGAARFWLNQGTAGLALAPGGDADSRQAQIKQIRTAESSYIGERIVIGEQDAASPAKGRDAAQMVLDPLLPADSPVNAATMRAALAKHDADTNGPVKLRSIWAGDGTHDDKAGKALATVLFSGDGGVLVRSGEELSKVATPSSPIAWGVEVDSDAKLVKGKPLPVVSSDDVVAQEKDPQSVLNWFKQMGIYAHGTRPGTDVQVDQDAAHALVWVRRPPVPSLKTPPVVTICNLSDEPLKLSLKDDMAKLRLKGNFLLKIQRTYDAMGALNLDSILLPPYAVFIGELRY
jgi:Alpha amylase, catalytic domain